MQLGEYEIIKLRNSCDRYGCTNLIANQLKLPFVPYSFANWTHGWNWHDGLSYETIIGGKDYRKTLSLIVCNKKEKDTVEGAGYTNVVAGGLPFAYVPDQNIKPIPSALLAFLPHSGENEQIDEMQVEYLDFLASYSSDFSKIYVSIFWFDNCPNLEKEIRRRKLIPVLGARPDDKNSLIRIRRMLEYCPYVTSNSMGSHIGYALNVGCNVSLAGPFYEFDREFFSSGGNPRNLSKRLIDDLVEMQSKSFLKKKYPWLFIDTPLRGVKNVELGNKAVGLESKLDYSQIKQALGWTFGRQIYGYGTGMSRRIMRKIQI